MKHKQRPSDIDHHNYFEQWLAQGEQELRRVTDGHGSRSTGPAYTAPDRGKETLAAILIAGVILIQIVGLMIALLLMTPLGRWAIQQGPTETVSQLPPAPPEPILPASTPAPVDQPAPQVAETQPAQPEPSPPASVEPATLPQLKPSPIRLRGLEITQGIQVFNEPEDPQCPPDPNHPNHIFCNNSIPLVAGRHTLVRVYPACNGDCPASEIVVRLRLLKDGQEQANLARNLSAETLRQVSSLPLPDLRVSLPHSVNFEFFPPPAWMSGQITFEVEAIPVDAVETAPVSLALSKNFVVHKPLRIAYLPIQYQGLRPPEPGDIDYWLQRLYPVADIEYYRLPVPELVWEGELSKSEILSKLLYTYWLFAQHQPSEEWPDQLFGWLPQEFYNGGVSDPFWCPNCAGPHSSRVAFGGLRPEQDIGGPRILVHEIAHNLGAQHAWSPTFQEDAFCFKAEGADIRVDPEWPYTQTPHIQEVGIDLYSNPPVVYPPSFYDMMAYCARPWISPHTYRKLFDSPFLQPDQAAALPLANFKPQAEVNEQGTLLVSGVIYPDGTVSRPEIIRLGGETAGAFNPALEFAPPPGDDYCLEVQRRNSRNPIRRCFDAGFLDLETGQSTASNYFFTMPNIDPAEVASVTLSKNRVALVVTGPSNTPPEVRVTFPNGGENLDGQENITWEAGDADGDALHFDVLYSQNGGQSWLPLAVRLSRAQYSFNTSQLSASTNALIRVMASDGFYTSIDESDASFSIKAAQGNSLSILGPATVEQSQTFEIAITANQIGGPGLYGVQFKLNFDPVRLRVDNVRLHPDLDIVANQMIQNEAGLVTIVASRQGRVPALTGDMTLATVTLTALSGPVETNLNLTDVKAGAQNGSPLTFTAIQEFYLRISE
jgi:hypothetical protein